MKENNNATKLNFTNSNKITNWNKCIIKWIKLWKINTYIKGWSHIYGREGKEKKRKMDRELKWRQNQWVSGRVGA